MVVNYKEEVKRLEAFVPIEGSLYWKPTRGKYKVKALGELEEANPFLEEGKDPSPQVQIKLRITDDENHTEEKIWTMGIGKSNASTYGQLCAIAAKNMYVLDGVEFDVVVVYDGHKNSYTIF